MTHRVTTKRKTTRRSSPKRSKKSSKSAAVPARIVHKPAHEHPVSRQGFVPGQLIVRCKADVTDELPDVHHATIASLHTFALPDAVESPFKKLQQEGLIREIKPIFSRMTSGHALSVAPTNVAAAFAMSVRDSEADDLRGITMLRLARSTDLKKVEKQLAATPGIEYVHRVPRRWITARAIPKDPLFKRQWGLPAIGWLNPDPLPDASAVKVAVLDTGVDLTHRDLENVFRPTFMKAPAAKTSLVTAHMFRESSPPNPTTRSASVASVDAILPCGKFSPTHRILKMVSFMLMTLCINAPSTVREVPGCA